MLLPLFLSVISLNAQPSPRALQLHQKALVFDAHLHMVNPQFYNGGDIGLRSEKGQVDLVRAKEGGLDAMFFTVYITEAYYPARYETRQALRLIDEALLQIDKNKDKIGLALNASDIVRLNKQGRIAAMLDLEGGFDLDGDLGILRNLYRLGLRVAQLPAHNWANNFADSCCSAEQKIGGLNEHGRAVVKEMNRLGMVINVSHGSDKTIEQVLEVSTDPVMATHHGLRSLNNIPRTLPDDLVKKIAAKGGVIGFHIGCEFHDRRFFEFRTKRAGRPFWDTKEIGKKEAQMTIAEIDKRVGRSFPAVGIDAPEDIKLTVDEWFTVVDRVIELVGEDHVAIGSDFDGGPTPPKPIRDIRDLPLLTEAMLKRGYSETRIRKFLGENTLRVVRQVTEKKR
jgi:membrane dipeptidase